MLSFTAKLVFYSPLATKPKSHTRICICLIVILALLGESRLVGNLLTIDLPLRVGVGLDPYCGHCIRTTLFESWVSPN